jgi:23S rRNA pseudouridine2605 synthase
MISQPIIKLLISSGVGPRRQMTDAIKRGRVAINGKVVDSFLQPINVGTDNVTIDGKNIACKTEKMIYLILNKPKGIISTASDERGRKSVLDILPPKYQHTRLYPVGRLDKESTGLILLTNDGDFTYHLTHPKFEREKEYLVQVDGYLTTKAKILLEKGMDLEDGKTSPAKVNVVKSSPYNYSITIHDGKKRQVRRMFASLGYQVRELKRIRIDVLTIDGLSTGDTRELTPKEIRSLKKE